MEEIKENLMSQDNNLHKKKMSSKILDNAKRIGGGVVSLVESGTGLIVTVFIPPIGIPIAVDGILRLSNKIINNKSNKSMIMYSDSKLFSKLLGGEKNYITQNFNNIADLGKGAIVKDKKTFLLTQELNFLLGAEKYEDDGTKRVFNTKSQALTRLMLSRAQKAGLVENFECKEIDKRRLIVAKMMVGNYSDLLKKDRMFNMKFELSDKHPTEQQIKKFLGIDELDEEIFKIIKDSEGNISSINYKTSYALKDRLKQVKEKLFHKPSLNFKETPLLKESEEQDKKIGNEFSNLYQNEVETSEKIIQDDIKRLNENNTKDEIDKVTEQNFLE